MASRETATEGPGPSTGELRKLGAGVELGRYTLLRRIAAGGMAEVYAARIEGIEGFEKKVAIKKILPQFSMNKRFIDMIVDEAKIAVTLTHPNIAQVYELGLDSETYYIVMEYVDGRPLNRLLQKVDIGGTEKLELEHAVHIVGEVAKGLHHAHIQKDARGNPLNIIHRDVSPQNILLSYAGQVKLIDFGIARAAGRIAQTSAGVIKGKLRYLAPEIAVGEEPDARADVYCCGIVLFELLTGEAMFAPRTDLEAIEMASKALVRSPRLSNPEVPKDLEDIVMKSLRRERHERYASAKELYSDLRRFLNLHHPAYVGSELGDRMQQLFRAEMEEDRRLDEVAEGIVTEVRAQRARAASPPEGPLEYVAPPEAAALEQGTSPSYRQLVTRSIEIAPTGRGAGGETGEAAPTGAAAFSEAPTIAVEPEEESLPVVPSALRADAAPKADFGFRRLSVLVGGMFLGALAVLFAIWLGFSSRTEPLPPEEPPRSAERGGVVALSFEPGEVTGEVDIFVDGEWHSSTPARETRLILSREPHLIDLRAAEWALSKPVPVTPGEGELQLVLHLVRLGTIEFEGDVRGVRSSHGVVDGRTVRRVPLGVEVELGVERSSGPEYITKIQLAENRHTERVDVPKFQPPKPGYLKVTSVPGSRVYLDGRLRGDTPIELKLDPGRRKIRLEGPGGQSKEYSVEVKSGSRASIPHRWR